MNKKTIGLLGGILLLAGGLMLQNLYKKNKMKGTKEGGKRLKKNPEDEQAPSMHIAK